MSGKIFITGPGRSGTTFLMQLLTRLGMDTGFEPYKEAFVEEIRAGCEYSGTVLDDFDKAPRIIKGPVWAYWLKYILVNDIVKIDHVVMPLRDLTASAESRLNAGLDFMVDKEYVALPGPHLLELQENVLAMFVGKVVEACFLWGIPLTLMHFPKIIQDDAYCWTKVNEFAPEIQYSDLREKWLELVERKVAA